MRHYEKNTSFWTIDVDTARGKVFLQMRWQYTWNKTADVAKNWDYKEKKAFHSAVDREIWRAWSDRVKLRVTGTHDFCKRFKARDIPLDFDVKWVSGKPHWNVTVTKLGPGVQKHAWVEWSTNKIQLYPSKLGPRGVCNSRAAKPGREFWFALLPESVVDSSPGLKAALVDQTCKAGFEPIPHEFGHALGTSNGDEYTPDSPNRPDTDSIINIGKQIRERHVKDVLDVLNTMIPDCTFSIASIRK